MTAEQMLAIVALVVGSGGIGGAVSAILTSKYERGKLVAEARKIDAEADNVQIGTLVNTVKALQNEMDRVNKRVLALEGENKDLRKRVRCLEDENKDLREENAKLQARPKL